MGTSQWSSKFKRSDGSCINNRKSRAHVVGEQCRDDSQNDQGHEWDWKSGFGFTEGSRRGGSEGRRASRRSGNKTHPPTTKPPPARHLRVRVRCRRGTEGVCRLHARPDVACPHEIPAWLGRRVDPLPLTTTAPPECPAECPPESPTECPPQSAHTPSLTSTGDTTTPCHHHNVCQMCAG